MSRGETFREFCNFYDRCVHYPVRAAAYLAGALIVAVAFFVFYEVVCRYVFGSPTLWVMDFSIYFIMWAVFLGAAHTMRTRGHVLVDVVIQRFPPSWRELIALITHLLILGFSLSLVLTGTGSCISAYQMKELTLSALYVPLYYPMGAIPVGSLLLAMEELSVVLRSLGAAPAQR